MTMQRLSDAKARRQHRVQGDCGCCSRWAVQLQEEEVSGTTCSEMTCVRSGALLCCYCYCCAHARARSRGRQGLAGSPTACVRCLQHARTCCPLEAKHVQDSHPVPWMSVSHHVCLSVFHTGTPLDRLSRHCSRCLGPWHRPAAPSSRPRLACC